MYHASFATVTLQINPHSTAMADSQRFSGKVIAITGAASGIALATAHLLAAQGASLSLADQNEAQLTQVAQDLRTKYSTKIHSQALDVRKASNVDAWILGTIATFGHLHGAANLAGVVGTSMMTKTIAEQDEDDWEFVLGVNLTGVMHCLRAEMRVIEDGGSVVNAASVAGLQGRALNAAYSASKHGVVGLTRSVAKEFGGRRIRVNAVCP